MADLTQLDWDKLSELSGTQVREILSLLEPKSLKYSPHTPTPKQQVFMNLNCKEAFFGGAAGGGKSDALLMDALQYSDVKGYAAILFRTSFADLTKPGALIDRAKEWLLPYPNVVWREKDRKFEFIEKYGRHTDIISILQFGYLETDSDKYNYQGGEYQYVGFDELVHISESNYRYMFSRTRRLKGMEVPIRIRGASNPPDDGSGQWVYNRFVNPETKKPDAIFIPAGMDDNPYLDKEQYRESLEELDPVTRARLRDGVWTITRKGNMFKKEWFPEVDELPKGRVQVRFWDMAATNPEEARKRRKNAEPDWTVGSKISYYDGIYYIEDIERFREAPGETQEEQKRVAREDTKRATILMEQEPGSSGIISIQHYEKNVFPGYHFIGIKSTGSKTERANPVSALAEKGKIRVWSKCKNKEEFYKEAETFPGGVHDDIVDSVSGGVAYLLGNSRPTNQVPIIIGSDNGSYWRDTEYYEFG